MLSSAMPVMWFSVLRWSFEVEEVDEVKQLSEASMTFPWRRVITGRMPVAPQWVVQCRS